MSVRLQKRLNIFNVNVHCDENIRKRKTAEKSKITETKHNFVHTFCLSMFIIIFHSFIFFFKYYTKIK